MNSRQRRTAMNIPRAITIVAAWACAMGLLISPAQAAVQKPADLPLFVNDSVPPLNMLVVGRDHKLFFPAYNDASDLDGDGSIDIRYKPSIKYLGYFDSNMCYDYSVLGYFTPTSKTADKTCSGNWSGDYLNYLTTSRADALRKVLYGGYRYVDTVLQTILSRAYIPTDAHTWGKEYKSIAVDGYDLAKYTPYAEPSAGRYTLFANNSQGTNEATNPPLLRVLPNIANVRIFGWVSREVSQGGTTATNTSFQDITVAPVNYAVRVEVCKTDFLESNCKLYPNGKYKPTGILHDYGEGNQMYFGLMTGTYQNNLQGGALREPVNSFSNEVDTSTGIFGTAGLVGTLLGIYTKGGIIGTLDGLKITSTGCSTTGNSITNTNCQNWGNPLAEMMFETMRYFSGAVAATTGYTSGTADSNLGLSGVSSWTSPYSSSPNADATPPTYPSCSKPFETLFSDVNPNYDSDLPGSAFSTTASPGSIPKALADYSASSIGQTIWNNEVGAGNKNINIGQTGLTAATNDTAPTAKVASSLGNIRGLPEEPTKEGTYNAASVAYFGNTNPITPLGNQKVQTFSIALSSTLPRIQMPVGTSTITLVPFGKTTGGVTEQITGFYIDSLYNMTGQPKDSTVNGGRAQAVFRVVYDDCGQGCDYDMDAIVLYTVSVTADAVPSLDVKSETVYSVSAGESHMGYTISGTTQDGIYLEVTGGGNGNTHYALDTPGTQLPGSCPCSGNSTLLPGMRSGGAAVNGGTSHTRNFKPASARSVTNLKDPLWYAAKWGGFGNSDNTPTSLPVSGDWDSNLSGTPNNYFLVSSASTLKDQLSAAFNQIVQKNSSVAPPAAVAPPPSATNATATYTDSLNVTLWSGDLTKTTETTDKATGTKSTTINWTAAAKIPASGDRLIQMANAAGNGLQDFTYSNLGNRTYASVKLQTTLTSDQVDFIRGVRTKEATPFRRRASLLGDIVNSAPVVVGGAVYLASAADALNGVSGDYAKFQATANARRSQVYVGANDGMLHAFDAATGVEKFAFIPSDVISRLSALTAARYNTDSSLHRFYVDGTPVVSDVYFGGAWHTVLVGTLGAGGREIFALDITNPDKITLLWEFTSQNDVALGSTLSTPVIARLHSGEWGVIAGNGYNGDSGTASLFVLNVATGAVISKLTTSVTGNNGLSSPVVLDANADGIADYVYAGDLLGNLWRFDLIGTSLAANAAAGTYKVGFSNKPLYTATIADAANSAVQSITAPPAVYPHPSALGTIVIFGTGRYFASADKSTTDLQTLYGIWDTQTSGVAATSTAVLNRSKLQGQTITLQTATVGGNTGIRTVSSNAVAWLDASGNPSKYGWYLDLKNGNTLLGERMVDVLKIAGSVLTVATRTPITGICEAGITGKRLGLNPTTGGATSFSIFDLTRNGVIDSDDTYSGLIVSGFDSSAGGFSVVSGNGTNGLSTMYGTSGPSTGMYTGLSYNGRQSWRVIPFN